MSHTYQYPRPAVTVDCVVFGLDRDDLKVLLIQRANPPFQNCWALPGGFAEVGECLDDSARRELEEETGVKNINCEQFHAFSDPARDPREHVISVAYFALVNLADHRVEAADDARNASWYRLDALPQLAFDHHRILALATARLREKARRQPLGLELLPPKFALRQLQALYEKVLARALDLNDFHNKVMQLGILEELGEGEAGLYRFNRQTYKAKVEQGINFEL